MTPASGAFSEAAGRLAFVLANTRLQRPPHAPELVLHLADEITPIWRLTEDELGALGLPPPFWAFAWAGGQALARWLLDHPDEARGRRVLDFATGSGMVAIAAMKAGAAGALGSDIDVFAGAAVAANAAANGVEVTFTASDLLEDEPPDVDLICAGDISYEQPLAGRVRDWLGRASDRGVRVLMGDPGRSYSSRNGSFFWRSIRSRPRGSWRTARSSGPASGPSPEPRSGVVRLRRLFHNRQASVTVRR